MSYLAVIDLGSNSTRMVVEELQADGTFAELKRRKLDTRLAEGMDNNAGELTEVAMTRVIDALIEFKQITKPMKILRSLGLQRRPSAKRPTKLTSWTKSIEQSVLKFVS